MGLQKDEAVALRRLDYSENSQILVFFGREHGQLRLIAKGIKRGTKKAFAVGIDLLERGSVVFVGSEGRSGLGTVTEWRQVDPYLGLRTDARRLYAGQYAAEITSQLTEPYDPHPDLYEGLTELLGDLAGGAPTMARVVCFQLRLLASVGLMPILDRCAACGRAAATGRLTHFSSAAGGMICRDCEPAIVEKRRADPRVPAALVAGDIPEPLAVPAFDLLNYAISQAMGKPSRLAPYLVAPGLLA